MLFGNTKLRSICHRDNKNHDFDICPDLFKRQAQGVFFEQASAQLRPVVAIILKVERDRGEWEIACAAYTITLIKTPATQCTAGYKTTAKREQLERITKRIFSLSSRFTRFPRFTEGTTSDNYNHIA